MDGGLLWSTSINFKIILSRGNNLSLFTHFC
uniref:Uncharacterized protein n=1 Tax=Anguilla anguilla TaxID=7936 RepID=A0A0E9WGD6_ANGAN